MSALPNLAPQKTLRVGLFTHWQGTWAGFRPSWDRLVLPYLAGNCERYSREAKWGSFLGLLRRGVLGSRVQNQNRWGENFTKSTKTLKAFLPRLWRDLAGIVREVRGSTRGTPLPCRWFMGFVERQAPRRYRMVVHGWTPLSQKPIPRPDTQHHTTILNTTRLPPWCVPMWENPYLYWLWIPNRLCFRVAVAKPGIHRDAPKKPVNVLATFGEFSKKVSRSNRLSNHCCLRSLGGAKYHT